MEDVIGLAPCSKCNMSTACVYILRLHVVYIVLKVDVKPKHSCNVTQGIVGLTAAEVYTELASKQCDNYQPS